MAVHPKDAGKDNSRLQCAVCGKWKRMLQRKKDGSGDWEQVFFGGCDYAMQAGKGDLHVLTMKCASHAAMRFAKPWPTSRLHSGRRLDRRHQRRGRYGENRAINEKLTAFGNRALV